MRILTLPFLLVILVCACGGRVNEPHVQVTLDAGVSEAPDTSTAMQDALAVAEGSAAHDASPDRVDAPYTSPYAMTCAALDACCAKVPASADCEVQRAACMGDDGCCYEVVQLFLSSNEC